MSAAVSKDATVAVIGAGTMGSGIAQIAGRYGYSRTRSRELADRRILGGRDDAGAKQDPRHSSDQCRNEHESQPWQHVSDSRKKLSK